MNVFKGQRVRLRAHHECTGTVVHQWAQDQLVDVRWDHLSAQPVPVRMHWPEEIEPVKKASREKK